VCTGEESTSAIAAHTKETIVLRFMYFLLFFKNIPR
jgi:hypothetical protein